MKHASTPAQGASLHEGGETRNGQGGGGKRGKGEGAQAPPSYGRLSNHIANGLWYKRRRPTLIFLQPFTPQKPSTYQPQGACIFA